MFEECCIVWGVGMSYLYYQPQQYLQFAMILVSFWCDDFFCQLKVNYVVKSPCLLSSVGALSTLVSISNMFFSSDAK